MNEDLQEHKCMKENKSIIISCYYFYVIQNRMKFLFHFNFTHSVSVSWNWDLILSHKMRIQFHFILISCWFWFCFISQVTIQFHLILVSCYSDSVLFYFIKIWFCLISSHKDLISFQSQVRMRQNQNKIFWFLQSV